MNYYTIFCRHFDAEQTNTIKAIFDLAESSLLDSWQFTLDKNASVIIVNTDNSEGQKSYLSYQKTLPPYRIIQVSNCTLADEESPWHLNKKKHSPPSLRETINLFNRVALCLIDEAKQIDTSNEKNIENTSCPISPELNENTLSSLGDDIQELEDSEKFEVPPENSEKTPSNTYSLNRLPTASSKAKKPKVLAPTILSEKKHRSPPTDNQPKKQPSTTSGVVIPQAALIMEGLKKKAPPKALFSSHDYLFSLIQDAQKENAYCTITLSKLPPIHLLAPSEQFYFEGSIEELSLYCLAKRNALLVTQVTRAKMKKTVLKKNTGKLIELISFSVIKAYQGRLLAGYLETDIMKLKTTPKISSFSSLDQYHKIAKFMIDKETSLTNISEQLQIPLAEIFGFFNVCAVLGYIEKLPARKNTLEEPKDKSALSEFFASFFK